MFEEILRGLDNLRWFGIQFDPDELEQSILQNARQLVLAYAKRALMGEATQALDNNEEYRYPILRSHLLANLAKSEHYYVSPDLGTIQIFNEAVAGTMDDMIEGQQAAWKSARGTPEQRLFAWTFGIYKPGREGYSGLSKDGVNKFEDYPSYDEVIEIRLAAWGDKAPYWIFLNDGNAGSKAYPTFPGYPFVDIAQGRTTNYVSRALEIATRDIVEQLQEAWEKQIENTDNLVEVYVGGLSIYERLDIGVTAEGKRVQVESRGDWYMLVIGGHYKSKVFSGGVINEAYILR